MKGIDFNFETHLANLQDHPKLLNRCRSLYLNKLAESLTFQELAQRFKISESVAWRYFNAYRKVAQKYLHIPNKDELLASITERTSFYQKKQRIERKTRDICMLGREITRNEALLAELQGFLDRKPTVNVSFINNVVQNIINALPEVLKSQGLPEQTIQNVLSETALRLEQAQQPA